MKYFDIHVNYCDGEGYSIFLKANNDEQALQNAIDNRLLEEDGDEEFVDYINEIDEDEYNRATEMESVDYFFSTR